MYVLHAIFIKPEYEWNAILQRNFYQFVCVSRARHKHLYTDTLQIERWSSTHNFIPSELLGIIVNYDHHQQKLFDSICVLFTALRKNIIIFLFSIDFI